MGNSFIGNITNTLNYLGLTELKNDDYFISVVNISNFMDLIQDDDEEQKYICNLTLYNWVASFIVGYNNVEGSNIIPDMKCRIINYRVDQIVILFYNDIDEVTPLLEELIDRGAKDLGFNLTVGIGNKYQNLTDMYISYKEACSAAMLSCIYGKGTVYIFNDINYENKLYSKQMYILVETKLYENIKIGAFEQIKKDVAGIISQIKNSKLELDAVNTIINNIVLL